MCIYFCGNAILTLYTISKCFMNYIVSVSFMSDYLNSVWSHSVHFAKCLMLREITLNCTNVSKMADPDALWKVWLSC